MNPALIGGVFEIGSKLLDKFFPDPTERAQKHLELVALTQSGDLKELETRLSAILAEANSADPWTSRARPSFLYVMYVMILASIPMGFLTAFHPDVALAVTDGMKAWLAAIPPELYTLFGIGYVGYAGVRSYEKKHGVTK